LSHVAGLSPHAFMRVRALGGKENTDSFPHKSRRWLERMEKQAWTNRNSNCNHSLSSRA
jgi:hypothetical protein